MNNVIPFDLESQKTAAAKLVEGVSINTLQLAAKSLEVTDDQSYEQAVGLRTRFAAAEKKILEFWDPIVKAAFGLHKTLTAARSEMAKPYTDGKNLMSAKAENFLLERKRQQREADQALARAAEQERLRLAQEAQELAMRGHMKEAEQIEMRASLTVAPRVASTVPVSAGARVGNTYTAHVTDLMAVLQSIVAGTTPLMWDVKGEERPLVIVDEVVLRQIVLRQQTSLSIPGIEVREGVKLFSTPGGR